MNRVYYFTCVVTGLPVSRCTVFNLVVRTSVCIVAQLDCVELQYPSVKIFESISITQEKCKSSFLLSSVSVYLIGSGSLSCRKKEEILRHVEGTKKKFGLCFCGAEGRYCDGLNI